MNEQSITAYYVLIYFPFSSLDQEQVWPPAFSGTFSPLLNCSVNVIIFNHYELMVIKKQARVKKRNSSISNLLFDQCIFGKLYRKQKQIVDLYLEIKNRDNFTQNWRKWKRINHLLAHILSKVFIKISQTFFLSESFLLRVFQSIESQSSLIEYNFCQLYHLEFFLFDFIKQVNSYYPQGGTICFPLYINYKQLRKLYQIKLILMNEGQLKPYNLPLNIRSQELNTEISQKSEKENFFSFISDYLQENDSQLGMVIDQLVKTTKEKEHLIEKVEAKEAELQSMKNKREIEVKQFEAQIINLNNEIKSKQQRTQKHKARIEHLQAKIKCLSSQNAQLRQKTKDDEIKMQEILNENTKLYQKIERQKLQKQENKILWAIERKKIMQKFKDKGTTVEKRINQFLQERQRKPKKSTFSDLLLKKLESQRNAK